jgi:hypothetical protein
MAQGCRLASAGARPPAWLQLEDSFSNTLMALDWMRRHGEGCELRGRLTHSCHITLSSGGICATSTSSCCTA